MSAGQVAVVTGVGTGSLGEAIARGLRDLGFRVLTSTRTCQTTTDTHALELTSRESVAEFARWVHESTDRLDVVVNNAGVHLDLRSAWHEPHLVDGMEVHWRTNYLGTAQLTRLLVPLLLATAEAAGVPVLMRGSMMGDEIEFAYVDGSASGAPYVELARIGPQMREFYAAVKAHAQDGLR